MKNITLSIPDEILIKSREYARKQGTTLNDMVRELLKKTINSGEKDFIQKIDDSLEDLGIDTTKVRFNREELYER